MAKRLNDETRSIHIQSALQALPADFREAISQQWDEYCQQALTHNVELHLNADELQALFTVWARSDFFLQSSLRDPTLCQTLVSSGDLQRAYHGLDWIDQLQFCLAKPNNEDALMQRLRQFRRREMMRIAWRDLLGWSDVEETLSDLTRLADACIRESLNYLYRWLCKAEGVPRNSDGSEQHLLILGMGKLGADELNFSSDVDLIFSFQDGGEIRGRNKISCGAFFLQLGRQLIRVLDENTADGFVYRVDMRLRPYGDSGPLVMSLDALEEYYQYQGREWERYAMIKARVITGSESEKQQLMDLLHPFIYRRYLDFNVLESVRDLKLQIERKVRSKGMENNIKLGPGGIREIEFIVQSFQLLRGGQDKSLQQRSLLKVLQRLTECDLLPPIEGQAYTLAEAYIFLRRVENHIQEFEDAQTHDLPSDNLGQQRLAWSMGFKGWEKFIIELAAVRDFVSAYFAEVIALPEREDNNMTVSQSLHDVWGDQFNAAEAQAALVAVGFDDVDEAFRLLVQFREGVARKTMGNQARDQLNRLMPLLLTEVATTENAVDTLLRLIHLLEAIVGRSVYLTLLIENSQALTQLIKLCSASPWIAAQLLDYPLLLDELLDPRTLYAPQRHKALLAELDRRFAGIDDNDLEWQMEALRQFRHSAVLRVAAADVVGAIPLMVVSDYLTEIAEVVLDKVLALAHRQQAAKKKYKGAHDFAVIAYGKMGGIELGYGSDLDLVFLHNREQDKASGAYFARLGQRMIHMLNTLTPSGVLYEVDMRLRPSGASGLLVSGLRSFADYQAQDAWTWEHQALVRARVVAGSKVIAQGFASVRAEILSLPRQKLALQQDIVNMRDKMLRELGGKFAGKFNIKRDRGGITDIEFIVQYGVLLKACDAPELVQYTDNIRLLAVFAKVGLLSKKEAAFLSETYQEYRSRVHQLTLMEITSVVGEEVFAKQRRGVIKIWEKLMV